MKGKFVVFMTLLVTIMIAFSIIPTVSHQTNIASASCITCTSEIKYVSVREAELSEAEIESIENSVINSIDVNRILRMNGYTIDDLNFEELRILVGSNHEGEIITVDSINPRVGTPVIIPIDQSATFEDYFCAVQAYYNEQDEIIDEVTFLEIESITDGVVASSSDIAGEAMYTASVVNPIGGMAQGMAIGGVVGTSGAGGSDFDSCMDTCTTLGLLGAAVACTACVTTGNPIACVLCGAIGTNIWSTCGFICGGGSGSSVSISSSSVDITMLDQAVVQEQIYCQNTGDLLYSGSQNLE